MVVARVSLPLRFRKETECNVVGDEAFSMAVY